MFAVEYSKMLHLNMTAEKERSGRLKPSHDQLIFAISLESAVRQVVEEDIQIKL